MDEQTLRLIKAKAEITRLPDEAVDIATTHNLELAIKSERIADLEAELERLKLKLAAHDYEHNGKPCDNEDCPLTHLTNNYESQITALEAENERLNERFPCGHRKIDWDDSYGECMACKLKEAANDYDNLPLDVIECHAKIEALEFDLAATKTAWQDAADIGHERIAVLETENERLRNEVCKCPTCDGTGFMDVLVRVLPPDGREELETVECAECHGTTVSSWGQAIDEAAALEVELAEANATIRALRDSRHERLDDIDTPMRTKP